MENDLYIVSMDSVYSILHNMDDVESNRPLFRINIGILERLDMLVKLKMGELGITEEKIRKYIKENAK